MHWHHLQSREITRHHVHGILSSHPFYTTLQTVTSQHLSSTLKLDAAEIGLYKLGYEKGTHSSRIHNQISALATGISIKMSNSIPLRHVTELATPCNCLTINRSKAPPSSHNTQSAKRKHNHHQPTQTHYKQHNSTTHNTTLNYFNRLATVV